MRKRYIGIIALCLIAVLLLTSAVSGQSFAESIGNAFSRGFDNLQDFVTDGYKEREQILGFFLLFFIFFSAFYAGLTKTVFKEQKNAAIMIALSVSLISSLSIISQTEFSFSRFRWVAEGLFFLLLVSLIFSLLTAKIMEKHRVWAFILAVLIAAFLVFVMDRLATEGPGGVFKNLRLPAWARGGGEKTPGKEAEEERVTRPYADAQEILRENEKTVHTRSMQIAKDELTKAVEDYNRISKTGSPEEIEAAGKVVEEKRAAYESAVKQRYGGEAVEGEKSKSKFGNLLYLLIAFAVIGAAGTAYLKRDKLRDMLKGGEGPFRKTKRELKKLINAKGAVIRDIIKTEKQKQKVGKDIVKIIQEFNAQDEGAMYYRDPDHAEFKKLSDEKKDVGKLFIFENKLEENLIKLYDAEKKLAEEIDKLYHQLSLHHLSDEEKRTLDGYITELRKNIIPDVVKKIKEIFAHSKIEFGGEKKLEDLLSDRYMEDRIQAAWKKAKELGERVITEHFDIEIKIFKELVEKINKQIKMTRMLRRYVLKEAEKEEAEEKRMRKYLRKAEERGRAVIKGAGATGRGAAGRIVGAGKRTTGKLGRIFRRPPSAGGASSAGGGNEGEPEENRNETARV